MKVLKLVAKLGLWVGIPIGLIVLILRLTVVQIAIVGHNGMAPTMMWGEEVLVWKGDEFETGDIVVCRHPHEPGGMVIGRVIARGGMTVETSAQGALSISGTQPTLDFRGGFRWTPASGGTLYEYRWGYEELGNTTHLFMNRSGNRNPLRVPRTNVAAGTLYLLNDNREARDTDSRSFGAVEESTCVGTVFMHLQPQPFVVSEPFHGETLPAVGTLSLID